MLNYCSLIIPVYNEKNRILNTLNILNDWIKKNKNLKYEIIIVDDGSVDRTVFLIKDFNKKLKLNLKIFKEKHHGQFHAISVGIKKSNSNYPVILEADLSASPEYINALLKFVPKYDIITGSRFLKESQIINKPIYRDFISLLFLFVFKIMFKTKITDPQLSFKIYNRNLFLKLSQNLVSKLDGMKSTEVMLRFDGNHKKIKEIPLKYIFYDSDRNVRKSKILSLLFDCFSSLVIIWLDLKKKHKLKLINKKVTNF
jgi:glycosyltransferase involved in cell wall biosynthesis